MEARLADTRAAKEREVLRSLSGETELFIHKFVLLGGNIFRCSFLAPSLSPPPPPSPSLSLCPRLHALSLPPPPLANGKQRGWVKYEHDVGPASSLSRNRCFVN